MENLWFFLLFLFASPSFCSPIDQHYSEKISANANQDNPQLPLGDETILDNIIKVNKDNDVNIYEGDIDLSPDDNVDLRNAGDVDAGQNIRRKRNAARDRKRLWVTRLVPYEYDSQLPDYFKPTIQEAIAEYENKTCVTFVQRTTEELFIRFVHEKGCWSAVGRQYWMIGLGQPLSLGPGCNHKGTIIHEIMHALGFWHEQSRPDRNLYVEVLWENIQDGEEHNFNKYSRSDIDRLKIPYDFDSVMHYGRKSFSKNGRDTIRSILNPSRDLGQRNGLTDFDIQEINALYDCSITVGWSRWSNFGPCSTFCYKSRQRFCTSSDKSKCPEADQYGVQQETGKCNNSECYAPIDGHWGRWSQWGACDADCGFGTHHRTRSCDDPPPKYGGKPCNGSPKGSQSCKLKSCGIGPDDCEFDADKMCHWNNDPGNPSNFNWERRTGTTPSSMTGPSGDHTSGTGHYIYTEASGINKDQKARLQSRNFPPTNGRCLSFWYHMYGSGIGQLNVYIESTVGAAKRMWSLSGDQEDEWKMAQITLSSAASEYKVTFEAVRGTSFRADIALDDISFKEIPCLEAIGCYRDRPGIRALPELVKDLRPKIDWFHIDETIANCSKLVQSKGYKYFGVQFYGECWSGSADYGKYGVAPPENCWQGVGIHWTNYVYKIM